MSHNNDDDHAADSHISKAEQIADSEKQGSNASAPEIKSVYAGLGWVDRLLALWILLAIIIGMLIGNYVDGADEALQRGEFVGVSIPIGSTHGNDLLVPQSS